VSAARIVSLLPSATEVVFALGLEGRLVGVTHECDWPPEARALPQVSRSTIPADATSAEIDVLVSRAAAGGPPTTELDDELLRALEPDLVLTQDLCAVCAVPSGDVTAAMARLGGAAQVVSLDPSTLGDVLDGVTLVGAAADRQERAAEVVAGLRRRLDAVRDAVAGRSRPRVLAVEWADPLFGAGHWVPAMVELAGGVPLLARSGERSGRLEWSQVAAQPVDVLVHMPCGHPMATAVAEARELLLPRPELAGIGTVAVVHGDAYFSRPGPRLVDGVEILAGLLHPDACAPPGEAAAVVLRS
jgi:iron complex transport system substrate-binding protein